MKKERNQRNEPIHLYNPKKEGWTSYDINYTNALRKKRKIKERNSKFEIQNKRYVA